jgi:hypothetical protein
MITSVCAFCMLSSSASAVAGGGPILDYRTMASFVSSGNVYEPGSAICATCRCVNTPGVQQSDYLHASCTSVQQFYHTRVQRDSLNALRAGDDEVREDATGCHRRYAA